MLGGPLTFYYTVNLAAYLISCIPFWVWPLIFYDTVNLAAYLAGWLHVLTAVRASQGRGLFQDRTVVHDGGGRRVECSIAIGQRKLGRAIQVVH